MYTFTCCKNKNVGYCGHCQQCLYDCKYEDVWSDVMLEVLNEQMIVTWHICLIIVYLLLLISNNFFFFFLDAAFVLAFVI